MNKFSLLIIILFLHSLIPSFSQSTITLEDIWNKGTFKTQSVSGLESMNDGMHYTTLEKNYTTGESYIIKYKYETGKIVDTLVKSGSLIAEDKKELIDLETYQFSEDESQVLISTETEHIYRHSTIEKNYIYNLKTKKLSLLSDNKQRLATFSPNGNKIAFVRDNNLFVKDLVSNKETQITKDGAFNKIINGATDWVYEEEFSFDKAFQWSPDGNKIAFYRFDESEVKEFSMNMYEGNLYPTEYKFKYPKAGEKNSVVSILVYDINSGKTTTIDIGNETDQYIPRIKWTKDSNILALEKMNRLQNKLELLLANATTGEIKTILTETSEQYIEINNNLTFLNNKQFIWMSDVSGYNHLYVYDLTGKLIRQITSGNWEVVDFKGIDKKTNVLYYTSTESAPYNRDLYAINIDGKTKKKLSSREGVNDVHFSNSFKYYINIFSDANSPYYITLNNASGKEIRVLENNDVLIQKLKNYNLSKKEFIKFTTSEGVELNGWIIKPNNFNANKKYPVFMTVYGGPHRQTVMNEWNTKDFMWHQMLAQQGYIIASFDNRGTDGRGVKFKKCTYGQMGKLETEDQIEAAQYLGSLAYIDKTRIGIQGWSYGGYMSTLCMTKGVDYFKCGIAVAPVSNWRFYDSIYTERYMGLPKNNAKGYDENAPLNFVDKLKGLFLLVHGTADDNVHFQNSVELVNALINANKQFDFYIYPDKNHSINGGNSRLHLYTKMTNFVLENL